MGIFFDVINGTKEEEDFINYIVLYIIRKFPDKISLANLQRIEIVDDLSGGSSARCEKNLILLARHNGLDNVRKSCDIEKDIKNSERLHMLVSTIYHELWHITTWEKYQEIYECIYNDATSDVYVILGYTYWIEYLSHNETVFLENKKIMEEFCCDFVNKKWEESNYGYLYFIKAIPYYIVRSHYLNIYNVFTEKIKSEKLKYIVKSTNELSVRLLQNTEISDLKKANLIVDLYRDILPKMLL